jgi:uncharacterized protein YjbI with pentapeptide repeats
MTDAQTTGRQHMHQIKPARLCLVILMALFCFQLVAVAATSKGSSGTSLSSLALSNVEKFIIKRISNGEVADLLLFFDEKQRILSAEFLVKLITEPHEDKHGKPLKVRIANAIFIEPLDLSNRTLHNETRLSNCSFEDFVTLNKAVSKVTLSFEGSRFKTVSFEEAMFEKTIILRRAEISENLVSRRAKFLYSKRPVFLDRIRVGGSANFSDAMFNGGVTFENARFANFFMLDRSEIYKDAIFDNVDIGRHFSAIQTIFATPDSSPPVSFKGMKVKSRVLFEKAKFKGGADFTRVDFKENFIANGALFESNIKPIFFAAMRVGGTMLLNNAEFKGPVLFNNAEIKGYLLAQDIQFGNQTFPPLFNGMKVGEGVSFRKAIFKANANFSEVQCNFFNAEEAQFQNTSKKMPILFERMRINDSVYLKKAKFSSDVKLDDMSIDRDLNAQETQFLNEAQASVNRTNIRGSASFKGANFSGTVNFENSNFGRNLYLRQTVFENKANAFFRRINIKGSAFFDEVKFHGTVNFENSVISRFFSAQYAEFHMKVDFKGMKIGYDAVFDSSQFWDSAIFDGSRIGLNFGGEIMDFRNPDALISFEGMTVGETARFENAIFEGKVNLKYANFRDLIIHGTKDGTSLIKQINLERAQVKRQLDIKNISFENLLAVSLKVEGPADLDGLIIRKKADSTHSSFSTLKLQDICLPKAKNSLILDGVNYWSVEARHISAQEDGNCQGGGGTVIIGEEVERSIKYDSSVYTDLEAFYKRKGDPDKADSVYIAQKDREMEDHNLVVQALYYLWAVVAGYGRKPLNTFLFSAFVIAIGCIVFRKEAGMVPKGGQKDKTYKYNRLWYSIDLFMPFVDLHTANAWVPERNRKFAPHWARLQRFLGLMLVPIFLAALTGIIK